MLSFTGQTLPQMHQHLAADTTSQLRLVASQWTTRPLAETPNTQSAQTRSAPTTRRIRCCRCQRLACRLVLRPLRTLTGAAAVVRDTAPPTHAAAPQHQCSLRLPPRSHTIWVVAEVRHRDAAGSIPKRTQLLRKLIKGSPRGICVRLHYRARQSCECCLCQIKHPQQHTELLFHTLQGVPCISKLLCTTPAPQALISAPAGTTGSAGYPTRG
jgi:hypothetical protein